MFRAKLKVTQISHLDVSEGVLAQVTMQAVYSENKEDNSFSKWTPTATFAMTVTNPAVLEQLKPGKLFYVDFTEVA